MFPLSENEAVLLMNEFDNGPIHVEENGRFAAIPDDSIAMKCRVDRPCFTRTDPPSLPPYQSGKYLRLLLLRWKLWMVIGNGQKSKVAFPQGALPKSHRAKGVDSGNPHQLFVRKGQRSKDTLDPASVGLEAVLQAEGLISRA